MLNNTVIDVALESYMLGANQYQIELLANLDRVADAGAPVIVAILP